MARRMTKSTQRTDEMRRPINGTEQPIGSLEHGTAMPAADGGLPSDVRNRVEVLAYISICAADAGTETT
jgi:hypothetical protein